MKRKRTIRRRRLLLTAAVGCLFAVGGCGDDDDSDDANEKPPESAVSIAQVEALKLNTPRARVEARFGPPAKPTFVDPGFRNAEPKRFTCTYYHMKGGGRRDFVQLCFNQKRALASKLSLGPSGQGGGGGAGAGP